MNAPADTSAMHLAGAEAPLTRKCRFCTTLFKPRRSWAEFCSTKCRNDFHGAERRKAQQREAAPELFAALVTARQVITGRETEFVVVNYPEQPAMGLGQLIDQALAKAGYKEPKA